MQFIDRFIEIRPFAYHVTQRANLARLARSRRLYPAADLIRRSGELSVLRARRGDQRPLNVDGEAVVLQDQRPLILANAQLDPMWTEGDFIEFLNEHVFFWPGVKSGPIRYGARLLDHYEEQSPAVIRVCTATLLAENCLLTPLFCAFNSGAPRRQGGRCVRRGRDLFLPAATFPRSPGGAVELVFRGAVELPNGSEFATPAGHWVPLDDAV